jgi:adenylate cyclase
LAHVFDLQDRIAEAVAGALQPTIRAAEITFAQRKRPGSFAAYDLVMRAFPYLWAHRKAENAQALTLLSEALEHDPGYHRAAALAAWAHAQQVCYLWTEDFAAERAEGGRLIEFASDGVHDDPTALTALSTAIMLLFADLDRAKLFVERALALDSNHAWAWTRLGFLHVYRGDPAAGRPCFERAIRLSPLDPFSFNCFIGLGLAAFAAGRPQEAAALTQRAISQKPGVTWMFRDLATFLAHAGQPEAAHDAIMKLVASRPDLSLSEVADAVRFMEPNLRERYITGLRVAGLRE